MGRIVGVGNIYKSNQIGKKNFLNEYAKKKITVTEASSFEKENLKAKIRHLDYNPKDYFSIDKLKIIYQLLSSGIATEKDVEDISNLILDIQQEIDLDIGIIIKVFSEIYAYNRLEEMNKWLKRRK